MSASSFSHVPAPLSARRQSGPGPPGATAVTDHMHPHHLGNALRAFRVYVITAFEVAVFGEYAEAAERAGKVGTTGRTGRNKRNGTTGKMEIAGVRRR